MAGMGVEGSAVLGQTDHGCTSGHHTFTRFDTGEYFGTTTVGVYPDTENTFRTL